MTASYKFLAVLSSLLALTVVSVVPASAKCTRLAYSVNDYGKVEPAKDAKRLLDRYIASWTSERGITGYRTGPKSVNCELFLDFIVFDEYTCRAEATVCWGRSSAPLAGGDPGESGPRPSKQKVEAPAASEPNASSGDASGSGASVSDSRYVTGE